MKHLSCLLLVLLLIPACGAEPLPSSSDDAETPNSTNFDESATPTGASEENASSSAGNTASNDAVETGSDETTNNDTVEAEGDETNDNETIETELDHSDDCELQLRAEVRDQSGPCTTCSFGDYITVVGIVENPCAIDLIIKRLKTAS